MNPELLKSVTRKGWIEWKLLPNKEDTDGTTDV